jgi:NCS1 family nucleobase:cation symporter-1
VAVIVLVLKIFPGLQPYAENSILGLSTLGWVCFLALWLVQLLVLRNGMESIRVLVDWSGPAIYVAMFALAAWIWYQAGSGMDFNLGSKELSAGGTVLTFLTAIALVVNYFSTLMLNFTDFSRFAPTERMVRVGNFWGLPVNFVLFSAVVVVITAGSLAVYGEAISDPVQLVAKIPSIVVLLLGAITFAVATIGINIVANFVSPCYDLANTFPKHIDFKRAGLITAVLAILVTPWNIYNSPVAINYFLGGLGALLGPLFGIIVVDYYLVKRGRIDEDGLYREGAGTPYWYTGGVNRLAVGVFVVAAVVSVVVALVPAFGTIAPFSWFVGAGLAAVAYYFAMRGHGSLAVEGAKDVRRSEGTPLEKSGPGDGGEPAYGETEAGEAKGGRAP